ncbi:MAG: glycosyltransferase family 9 protein [Bryobacteraceae bacterium]
MASTSCNRLAEELLDCCLRGQPRPAHLLRTLIGEECSPAFFGTVIEGLGDRFEPRLCRVYAELFAEALEGALPEFRARDLVERYERVRRPRRFEGDAERVEKVFVLSRVTLGADVAVTSVMLDAARRRFPNARIFLVGSLKSWEMFAGDPRIAHAPLPYPRRGSLSERLASWQELKAMLSQPASITIDPDSRLTQLGLLPVCPEEDYFFFESRGYGGDGGDPLPVLARRWAAETLGAPDAVPFLAPASSIGPQDRPFAAVSLGVGENPAKRIPDPFEEELLRMLLRLGYAVLIDKGAGGEETERVERAVANCDSGDGRIFTWQGAFAPFAGAIARSRLYVGYDSAGQHVAAACGVPLLTVFAGFVSERMFQRWRPWGRGPIQVLRVEDRDPEAVLARAREAIGKLLK